MQVSKFREIQKTHGKYKKISPKKQYFATLWRGLQRENKTNEKTKKQKQQKSQKKPKNPKNQKHPKNPKL